MGEIDTGAGTLLALDTSGDVCSVAVLQAGTFVAEHTFRHGMHLSERLLAHVEGVLTEADTTLAEVATFAVGLGPGSFTGTRIGVMTIKTLASVLERPIYGIDSMEILAQSYAGLRGSLVAPMLPCRKGMVYTALYSIEKQPLVCLQPPEAVALTDLGGILTAHGAHSVILCGPASQQYRTELKETLVATDLQLSFGEALFPRAAALGAIVTARQRSGISADDALALVPLYVSPPPISQPKVPIPTPD